MVDLTLEGWDARGAVGLGQVRWDEDKGKFVPTWLSDTFDVRSTAATPSRGHIYKPGKSHMWVFPGSPDGQASTLTEDQIRGLVGNATASFIRGRQGYSGVSVGCLVLDELDELRDPPEPEPVVKLEGWDDDPFGD